ncbi:MAG: hypothetical protein KAI77_08480, partial [Gammaproteobacteria bacterium]|nr:hypothetical protein [Gammaproteobacteria bacterium]
RKYWFQFLIRSNQSYYIRIGVQQHFFHPYQKGPANGKIISHRLDVMAKGAVNDQIIAGRIIL